MHDFLRGSCRAALLFMVLSCTPKVETELVPPETPLFSKDTISYGVINQSFVNLLESPGTSSEISALVRKGAITRIVERKIVITASGTGAAAVFAKETWDYVSMVEKDMYAEKSGWLRESALDRYENMEQAQNAARMMPK